MQNLLPKKLKDWTCNKYIYAKIFGEAANLLNINMQENDLIILKASNAMNFSKILEIINVV